MEHKISFTIKGTVDVERDDYTNYQIDEFVNDLMRDLKQQADKIQSFNGTSPLEITINIPELPAIPRRTAKIVKEMSNG